MRNQKTFQLSTLSAAVASALIGGHSGTAVAQGAVLEEVIVTASRRSESVQDIPLNITALSADMIERERLSDLVDIARRVPGMTVLQQGGRAADVITVRGLNLDAVGPTDGTNGGDAVGTYVGDIPFYVDFRLNDIDRVEVLIGPQGTLYGAGTLAGAVRYLPNRPQTDALSMELRGDVFDLEQAEDWGYDAGATVNIPIIDDRLALRATLDYYDDPGFIDYNYLVREAGVSNPQPDFTDPDDVSANLRRKEDANYQETTSGRLALRYTGDMIDANLSYYYQDDEVGARQINHKDAFDTGDYEAAHRFPEPLERENELYALEIVADLGFAELTSATGYSMYDEDGQRDQTDLLLHLDYGYEFFPELAAFTRDTAEEDTFTQEIRLVSTGDGPWNWIIGGFYSDQDIDALSREFVPNYDVYLTGENLRPDNLEYYEKSKETIEETAIFGELGYQLTDAWQVTVGARWFDYKDDASLGVAFPLADTVFGGAPPDSILLNPDKVKEDYDDVIYKFNTSYDFNDDVMGYGTISEGYRIGGLNLLEICDPMGSDVQTVCIDADEVLIEPDKTTNYELGVRSVLFDTLVLNAAIYYIEWDDVQVAGTTEVGTFPITVNGGSAESMGLELSSRWAATENLSFSGSYAYNEAELTDDAPGLVDGEDALDGDRLPGSPEHQYYLGANYVLALNDGSSVEFDWAMTGQSNVFTKVGNRSFGEKLDGYTLHNASVSWLQDNVVLTLYADNLFDEYAETGVRRDTSFIGPIGVVDSRRYYHNVLRPRQVGMRVVYNFEN
ncbi:MAG: TonB-dependent receptor [Halioglobus sp.]|nr:TonB-dependent receptor [Halioglobus sp.]